MIREFIEVKLAVIAWLSIELWNVEPTIINFSNKTYRQNNQITLIEQSNYSNRTYGSCQYTPGHENVCILYIHSHTHTHAKSINLYTGQLSCDFTSILP